LHPLQICPFIGEESFGLYLFGTLKLLRRRLTFEFAKKVLDWPAKLGKAALIIHRRAVSRFYIKSSVPENQN
jgi:hypothetical protein